MRTLILFLSDIHFRINGAAENQGKVINAFLEDVPKLLSKINYDDLYVIITGDLVHAADNYNNYEGFYETIIKSLQSSLSLDYSHFIVIPGNHDVQQSLVKECKNIYFPVVESIQKESIFNDTISNESTKGIFTKQFSNFKKSSNPQPNLECRISMKY